MINYKKKTTMLLASLAMVSLANADDSRFGKFFHYSPGPAHGYHLAYADTDSTYKHLGQLFSSDYSRWGSEKKMYSPMMIPRKKGGFVAVFQVNDYSPCFAVTVSEDLVTWRPQDYPRMSTVCIAPVVYYDDEKDQYVVLFKTKDGKVRQTTTNHDFRHFTPDVEASKDKHGYYTTYRQKMETAVVDGKKYEGYTFSTQKPTDIIFDHFKMIDEFNKENAESLRDDPKRFESIMGKQLKAKINVNPQQQKKISDKLIGVFFEDISYAADGGLYAELIQNRDFEYKKGEGRDKQWGPLFAWRSAKGNMKLATDNPLSLVNKHHIVVTAADTIYNSGWDGIRIDQGALYDFSLWLSPKDVKSKKLTVALVDGNNVLAQTQIKTKGKIGEWKQYQTTLKANASSKAAQLMLITEGKGGVAMDMISLFPQETFCKRKNGLRKDIAQAIADLKPRFVRFPGGCMTHGDGLENIYHWQHTVGPLHERTPDRNVWNYHQTRGLGFYEYFQFCEDIGAEPLPVLAAGVPCQNSGPDEHGYGGQQGGIPMEDMPAYIQEFLDLIEWANGDPATSKWAKMRADAGHPKPFNLKYIGVGNEDLISTVFEERCLMISKAIKEKYPDIEVCGTVGPFHYPSSDYIEGWKFANKHRDVFDMVDEHYYESVGWFLNNQDYYDNYDRTAPKVYLGEYAVRVGKGGVDCALAEAAYLCSIERNADVVVMTSYAPLLSKNGHSNWSPDMMYFDNHHVDKTPSYWTQWLFGNYSGDTYLSTAVELLTPNSSLLTPNSSLLTPNSSLQNRLAASVVRDSKTGRQYLKIANVSPVEVSFSLSGITPSSATMKWQGFSGKPGQQRVKLETGEISDASAITMPPYSFWVISL